jgi:peptidoglycan/LPS O-acetylase OafA/YrhL
VILTAAFWRAAGQRVLYTVLAAAVVLITPLVGVPDLRTVLEALVALAFVAIAALATSLANLPELGDGRRRWVTILDRTVRSFFQVLAGALAAAATFSDLDWPTVLWQSFAAALITLIRVAKATLPEAAATSPGGAHVITTAPKPASALAEGDRVTTPGGAHGVITSLSSGDGGYTATVRPDDPLKPT